MQAGTYLLPAIGNVYSEGQTLSGNVYKFGHPVGKVSAGKGLKKSKRHTVYSIQMSLVAEYLAMLTASGQIFNEMCTLGKGCGDL